MCKKIFCGNSVMKKQRTKCEEALPRLCQDALPRFCQRARVSLGDSRKKQQTAAWILQPKVCRADKENGMPTEGVPGNGKSRELKLMKPERRACTANCLELPWTKPERRASTGNCLELPWRKPERRASTTNCLELPWRKPERLPINGHCHVPYMRKRGSIN